ncbi:MAG: 50S ribosomal protein L1 [Candidatus Cloacimonetes bacterium]|nr:50S ribosomal protein L1 [Candidatus Cloacimonadota bacterium]
MKRSKGYKHALEQFDTKKNYSLSEATSITKKISFAKFDETLTVDVVLGVDPRHADQMVRGTVALPHGTGKETRVVAIVAPDKEQLAKDAGATFVGGQELVDKIKGGWLDYEVVVTTPDMMRFVGQLGKILGPRGMMPNPKVGTVTPNIEVAIKEIIAGRLEYKVDKYGIVHLPFGKRSFNEKQLFENVAVLVNVLLKAKPASAKGIYVKSVTLSPTMGPGVKVDTTSLKTEVDSVNALVS